MNTRDEILKELYLAELTFPGAAPSPASKILDLAVRYREALESIIANEEAYNRGDALSAHLAKSALNP